MMVVYLLFDGFTSTWQERLFKKTKVSTWNQVPVTRFPFSTRPTQFTVDPKGLQFRVWFAVWVLWL